MQARTESFSTHPQSEPISVGPGSEVLLGAIGAPHDKQGHRLGEPTPLSEALEWRPRYLAPTGLRWFLISSSGVARGCHEVPCLGAGTAPFPKPLSSKVQPECLRETVPIPG
jgi:hypothetical protein